MNYSETINQLFSLLTLANNADSDQAEDWQRPEDARGFTGEHAMYQHVTETIDAIAGRAILDHYFETGEIDITLASRYTDLSIMRDRLVSTFG